jgi:hypothetical protein
MILKSLKIYAKVFLTCKGIFFCLQAFPSKLQASLQLPPQFLVIVRPKQRTSASCKQGMISFKYLTTSNLLSSTNHYRTHPHKN